MYPFFETIRYCKGAAENLFFHQQRIDRTFKLHSVDALLQLAAIDFNYEASMQNAILPIVYKCKISYNITGSYMVLFEPYSIRKIQTFTFVEIGSKTYDSKYTDRTWINLALNEVQTDEVIFTKNNLITDASYANVAFFNGTNWLTPAQPLLAGTRRAMLLKEKYIIERAIYTQQLSQYHLVKFINAMMHWEECPCIQLH